MTSSKKFWEAFLKKMASEKCLGGWVGDLDPRTGEKDLADSHERHGAQEHSAGQTGGGSQSMSRKARKSG